MRKLLLFLCLTVLVSGGAALALTLDEAVALFQGNDIMVPYSDEGKATLEEMIDAFRGALGVTDALDEENEDDVMDFEVDAGLIDIVGKLSQTYYTYADAFLGGADNERQTYIRGKHWGLKGLRMDETFATTEESDGFVAAAATIQDISIAYWAAANWLRAAQFDPLGAVFGNVPEKTEAINLRCLELDETYMAYGGYRALGGFWSGLPKLPAGNYRKNWSRSLGYFCHVVDEPEICDASDCDICPPLGDFDPVADEYLENRAFFVEFYLMPREMWEDAKRILEEILTEPVGEDYPLYNAISLEKAATFLAEVEEHL
jgi:hypothetical protein